MGRTEGHCRRNEEEKDVMLLQRLFNRDRGEEKMSRIRFGVRTD